VFGIGATSALQPNSWVFGFFRDGTDHQDPVILGTFSGGSAGASLYSSESNTGFGSIAISGSLTGGSNPSDANSFSVMGGLGSSSTAFTGGLVTGAAGGAYVSQSSFEDGPPPVQNPGSVAALIAVARSQIGVRENGSTNRGEGIQKYWSATDSGSAGYGQAWCAAFVCWCIKESGILPDGQRPTTAGARKPGGMLDWATGKSYTKVRKNPRTVYAGDIIVFSWSHVGIATTNSENGKFMSVDGNTTRPGQGEGWVWEKSRSLSSVGDAITIVQSA
jgi:hypothetical protein